jgi:hypothetical protein
MRFRVKGFVKYIGLFSGIILLCLFPYVKIAIYILLILYASFGLKNIIQALSIAIVLRFLTPALYTQYQFDSISIILILLAALFVIIRKLPTLKLTVISRRLIYHLIFFLATILFISVSFSTDPVLSVLKIGQFAAMLLVLILVYASQEAVSYDWDAWFKGCFISVVILSSLLIFHEYGYFKNAKGFQGILLHPQAFSVFMAPFVALLTGQVIILRRRGWILTAIMLITWLMLFKSLARTGLLAVILAFLLAVFVGFFLNRKAREPILVMFARPITVCTFLVLLIISALNYEWIFTYFYEFVNKREVYGQGRYFIFESRVDYIERSLSNFIEFPWTGIGFGIHSNYPMQNITRVMGVPVSAPAEKGFIITAILEENGIIGSIAFALFFMYLSIPIIRNSDFASLWMFFTCILINFGEMVLFSMGGLGLAQWLLIVYVFSSSQNGSVVAARPSDVRTPP